MWGFPLSLESGGTQNQFNVKTALKNQLVFRLKFNLILNLSESEFAKLQKEIENTTSIDDVLLLGDSSGLCEAQPSKTRLTRSCSSDISLKENITNDSSYLDYVAGMPLFDYTVKKTVERAKS